MIVDAEISIPGVSNTLFLSHSYLLNLFLQLLLGSLRSACLILLRFPLATLGPLRRLIECAVEVVLEVVRSSVGLPFRVPSLQFVQATTIRKRWVFAHQLVEKVESIHSGGAV